MARKPNGKIENIFSDMKMPTAIFLQILDEKRKYFLNTFSFNI